MKNLLLLGLTLLVSVCLFAQQITLTQSDFPIPGTSVILYSTNGMGGNMNDSLDVGAAGASSTYDFAKLTSFTNSDTTVMNYIAPSATPYSAQHTGATVALFEAERDSATGDTIMFFYNYFKSSATHFELFGISVKIDTSALGGGGSIPSGVFDEAHATYTPVDTIVSTSYSMGYNDVETSFFMANLPLMNYNHYETIVKIINVDGWGDLTTPYGTFNVLRGKVTEMDTSLDMQGIDTVDSNSDTSYYYEYWANGIAAPVLKVNMNSSWTNINYVEYVKAFPVAVEAINAKDKQINISPNPAKDEITVTLKGYEGIRNVVIYNLLAQQLLKMSINDHEIQIDISDLDKGIYLIGLTDDQGKLVSTKKLIVE